MFFSPNNNVRNTKPTSVPNRGQQFVSLSEHLKDTLNSFREVTRKVMRSRFQKLGFQHGKMNCCFLSNYYTFKSKSKPKPKIETGSKGSN